MNRWLHRACWMMLASAWLAGCATRPETLSRFEFSEPQMGVPFRIVLYASDATQAAAAADAAFARIEELNAALSDYDPESELSRLSRTSGSGKTMRVSDDLWTLLERAQELSARSDGAFDITVGPCVNLWRKARREKEMPDPQRLARARSAVGYTNVVLNEETRTATLLAPDMRLDLGGIAKGFAVDEALAVLQQRGISRALVAGAGDLAVGEPPPGKKGWRIEIAPLDATNAPVTRSVLLTDRAIATSGDVFQRLEIEGRRYSHIVDPRTCIGLTDHSLVTVIARDCTTADSLATTVSVLGPADGLKLIEQTPGAEVHIVRKPGETFEIDESSGFARFYVSGRRE